MRMLLAHGKRARYATALKAYIMLSNGETFSNVADKYAKGNHLFLNSMINHVKNSGIIRRLFLNVDKEQSFDEYGTEYNILRESYLKMLDNKEGRTFYVKYHYYTSHNTKSSTMTKTVQAYDRNRAQYLAQKSLGGDAIITATLG